MAQSGDGNPLSRLLDRFCSDKGTFWQSRHHYANAYHAVLAPLRHRVSAMIEIGIGEDTAPSVAAWLRYFPNAHIHALDIKDEEEFHARAAPGGATERLVRHQAQFGCAYDASMWQDPRVHLRLGVDASNPTHLDRLVDLPTQVDLIIDDGSHRLRDQEATLLTLWERVRPGGFYIIEDLLVGALPWDASHARQVPTNNTQCGNECFFPQRIADHPLLHDRFELLHRPTRLTDDVDALMHDNDWFWVVTGVHKGGGVDASLVLRKPGDMPEIASTGPPVFALAIVALGAALVRWRPWTTTGRRAGGYVPVATD